MAASRPDSAVSELGGEEEEEEEDQLPPQPNVRRGITPKHEPGLEELIYSVPEKVIFKDYRSMEPSDPVTRRLLIKVSEDSPKDKRRVQLFLPKIYPELFEIKGRSDEEYIDLEMGGVLMLSVIFKPPEAPEKGCKNFQDWVQFKDCTTKLVLQVPLQSIFDGEETDEFQPMFPPMSVLPPKTAPMPPSRGGLQSQGSASQQLQQTSTVDPSSLLEAADALLLECDEPVPGFPARKAEERGHVAHPPRMQPLSNNDDFEWSPDELNFYQAVVKKEEQRIKQDEFPEWDGEPEEKLFYKEWLEAEATKRQEEQQAQMAQEDSVKSEHATDSPHQQETAQETAQPRGFFVEQSIGLDGSPKIQQRSVLDVNPKEYGLEDEEVFLVDGVLINARGEEVKPRVSKQLHLPDDTKPAHSKTKTLPSLGGTVRDIYPVEEQEEESTINDESDEEELMPWEVPKKKAEKVLGKAKPAVKQAAAPRKSSNDTKLKPAVKSKEAIKAKAQEEYQERLKKAGVGKPAAASANLIKLGETVVTEKLRQKEGTMTAVQAQSKGTSKQPARGKDIAEQQFEDAWDALGA